MLGCGVLLGGLLGVYFLVTYNYGMARYRVGIFLRGWQSPGIRKAMGTELSPHPRTPSFRVTNTRSRRLGKRGPNGEGRGKGQGAGFDETHDQKYFI